MDTFQKEIEFLSQEFNADTKAWEEVIVKKTATFMELSRTDKSQHKLHFKLVSLFTSRDEEGGVNIDSDTMYDITVKFFKQMLILDESFTATNKNEFLQDSGAIFAFGMWLIQEKVNPFFLILTGTKKE
jgi:hypothetical protein